LHDCVESLGIVDQEASDVSTRF